MIKLNRPIKLRPGKQLILLVNPHKPQFDGKDKIAKKGITRYTHHQLFTRHWNLVYENTGKVKMVEDIKGDTFTAAVFEYKRIERNRTYNTSNNNNEFVV